jgi:hypothetical protein
MTHGLYPTTSEFPSPRKSMSQAKDNRIEQAFHVPLFLHLFSGFVHRWPRLWIRLGNLESWLLSTRLEGVKIDRPVYVAGLARSGSTILLEFLASHPDVVTTSTAITHRSLPPTGGNRSCSGHRNAPCTPLSEPILMG